MAYVAVRGSTARGAVAALVTGENFQGSEVIVEGTITREPDLREDALPLEYGHRISARGRLQRPKGASNPGEFDYAAYLTRQGIYATLSVWDGGTLQQLRNGGNPIVKAAIATRNRMDGVLRQTLPEPHASLLAGLLFGSTGGLPEDLQKAFRDTGVFHMIHTSFALNRENHNAR